VFNPRFNRSSQDLDERHCGGSAASSEVRSSRSPGAGSSSARREQRLGSTPRSLAVCPMWMRRARRDRQRRLASDSFESVAGSQLPLRPRCRSATYHSLNGRDRDSARPRVWRARSRAHLGRSPSTISRELRRSVRPRAAVLSTAPVSCSGTLITARSVRRRRRSPPTRSPGPARQRGRAPDGTVVADTQVRRMGQRHHRRSDRWWARAMES